MYDRSHVFLRLAFNVAFIKCCISCKDRGVWIQFALLVYMSIMLPLGVQDGMAYFRLMWQGSPEIAHSYRKRSLKNNHSNSCNGRRFKRNNKMILDQYISRFPTILLKWSLRSVFFDGPMKCLPLVSSQQKKKLTFSFFKDALVISR